MIDDFDYRLTPRSGSKVRYSEFIDWVINIRPEYIFDKDAYELDKNDITVYILTAINLQGEDLVAFKLKFGI